MYNTRFNPSVNGDLHLGHIYALLVNEQLAHQSGGKFYVRFDDTSRPTQKFSLSERIEIMNRQREVIEWLGIRVDGWYTQSEQIDELLELADPVLVETFKAREDATPPLPVFIRSMNSGILPYPYQPYQSFERVLLDRALDINLICRGEEFATEYSHYLHFCDVLNLRHPEFIFIPRLLSSRGDISKTRGGHVVREFKEAGWLSSRVINVIEQAALFWPPNGWKLHNLKPNPIID